MFTQIVDQPVTHQTIPLRRVSRKQLLEILRLMNSEFHIVATAKDVGWGRRRHYVLAADNFSEPARRCLEPFMAQPQGVVAKDYGDQVSLIQDAAEARFIVNGALR